MQTAALPIAFRRLAGAYPKPSGLENLLGKPAWLDVWINQRPSLSQCGRYMGYAPFLMEEVNRHEGDQIFHATERLVIEIRIDREECPRAQRLLLGAKIGRGPCRERMCSY